MKESKFLSLPMYHIDTSVILEKETTENGRYCKKYLNIVGVKYRGVVSFPVLSELFLKILKLETFDMSWNTLHMIKSLINQKEISFYSPINIADIENDIIELDKRIQPLDRQIIACAIENKATLITIDSKLLENHKLRELGLMVFHPKDII